MYLAHLAQWFISSLHDVKLEELSCGLSVGLEEDGLYYFTPTQSSFQGLMKGHSYYCVFHIKQSVVARSDFFPNWYIGSLGMKPKVIRSTEGETLSFVADFDDQMQWKRSSDDQYDPWTAEERYSMYLRDSASMPPFSVIPTPKNMTVNKEKTILFLKDKWVIVDFETFQFAVEFLVGKCKRRLEGL